MIDIRNHIVYGVDDGSLSLLQSEKMLHKLYMEGVTSIIATPNYSVGCVNPSQEELHDKLNSLVRTACKLSNGIQIYQGSELYYSEDLLDVLRKKKVETLAGTRYVLVNFHSETTYMELKTGIHRLLVQGFYPILSQVDKYTCFQNNMDYIDELIQLGTCMEVDTVSFAVNRFGGIGKTLKNLLEYDMIHFIASNAKTDLVKNYGMKEVFELIKLKYGKERACKLFYEHGEMVLENRNIARVC